MLLRIAVGTESVNVDFDGIAANVFLPAVKLCLELRTRAHPARPLHQSAQHGELAARQLQGFSVQGDLHRAGIEHDILPHQSGCRAAGGPAVERAKPGCDFIEVERLAEIVVGALIKAGDAVLNGIARGQQQNRRRVLAAAHVAQHIDSRSVGKHPVEHDGVEICRRQRRIGILATGNTIGCHAVQGQARRQPVQQDRIVLDHQNAHATDLLSHVLGREP
jgi:hypothetical protein